MKKLKHVLDLCGVDSAFYGSHSLRRGGASWALKCGLNGDLVRILGDWKSNAYMSYLEIPVADKVVLAHRLGNRVRTQVVV